MTAEVYHFSGTGNCLAVAREIAQRLDGTAIAIRDVVERPAIRPRADVVGVVFPTYLAALHGVPLIVERFLGKLEGMEAKWLFAVCTCGGHEIVNADPALLSLDRVARGLGVEIAAEYAVRLPMNNLDYEHIPVPIETDSDAIIRHAEGEIADVCGRIERRRPGRHHLARRLVTLALTPMYAMMAGPCVKSLREFAGEPEDSPLGFRELMPRTDASIRVDEACTGCGTCVKVCPVGNIELVDGKPSWRHRCEMCFACDEWCPRGAIHHWGRPNGAKYHHPGVRARDLYAATSL